MPTPITLLRVLVASPDDVAEERLIAREVIDGINQSLRDSHIRLEFLGWEDVSPGFGSDPQEVVNQQIGDDYDIFVGILWSRFGTPTPRAGSGTEEEFWRAYQRWQADPHGVHIMLFFSDAPLSPQVDLDQLGKVQRFRAQVSESGGLYQTFSSTDNFARTLRIALDRHVVPLTSDARSRAPSEQAMGSVPQVQQEPESTEQEVGYLDLALAGQQDLQLSSESITRMTDALKDLDGRIRARTAQMAATNDTRLLLRHSDAVAGDMDNFAQRIEGELAVFTSSYRSGMDAYSKALHLLPQFGEPDTEDLISALEGLVGMKGSLGEALPNIKSFRDTIERVPPASTALVAARSRVAAALTRLTEAWLEADRLASVVEGLLRQLTE